MTSIPKIRTAFLNNKNFNRIHSLLELKSNFLPVESLKGHRIYPIIQKPDFDLFIMNEVKLQNGHKRGTKVIYLHKTETSQEICNIAMKHTNEFEDYGEKNFPYLPSYYKDTKNGLLDHIYIEGMKSYIPDSGYGTKLIAEAIKESVKSGYKGRVLVEALNTDGRSPIPFYKKFGFKCSDERLDKRLDEIFKNLNKEEIKHIKFSDYDLPELDYDVKFIGMYLPTEKVDGLLAKYKDFNIYG